MNKALCVSGTIHIIVLCFLIMVPGLVFRRYRIPDKVYTVNLMQAEQSREVTTVVKKLPRKPKPVAKKKPVKKKAKPKPKPVKKKKPPAKPKPKPKKPEKTLSQRISERLDKEFVEPSKTVVRSPAPSAPAARSSMKVDADAFPHTWYLNLIQSKVKLNWNEPSGLIFSGSSMETSVAFVVLSNGAIVNVRLVRGAGNSTVDQSAMEAVRATALPPLPAGYKKDRLDVNMHFNLER